MKAKTGESRTKAHATLGEEPPVLRQARARAVLSRTRAKAKADGRDKMTMAQINAIIADVRREMREAK